MSTSVASVTKFFPTAQNGFTTTLASTVASGATTVPLNSVAGYTNGDTAVFIVDPTSATAKQAFTGVIDTAGVQVTGVIWTAGTNQAHTGGATVVDYTAATHINMVTKGLLIGHNQDGTHATNLPLTTPQITTSINDSGGNEVIKTPATASAVNEITVTNAATTVAPSISATGGDAAIALNLRGKGLAKSVTIGAGATVIFPYDYVVSGCVWTADAAGSTKAASMTAGVVAINGNPITVAAVTARTFTASKDVYVDVLDNGDGTGLLVYTDGTTNAASGALASNSIRLAIVVVGATNIAAAASINQGQEDRLLPIASSVAYTTTDSLGNLICPRDPQRKILGYRQTKTAFSMSSVTSAQITGLACPVIVPTGRKVKITVYSYQMGSSINNQSVTASIWDTSVGGTLLTQGTLINGAASSMYIPANVEAVVTPTATSKTYCAGFNNVNNNTSVDFYASATAPAFIKVELV